MNERIDTMQDVKDPEVNDIDGRSMDPADGDRPQMGASDGQMSTSDLASAMQGRQTTGTRTAEREESHLLPEERLGGYRDRWSNIQITFVDEPKSSVEQADSLVAEVIQTLAERFAEERDKLEKQWSSGGEASTEDLRQALKHYRSFFERLLAA